MLAVPFENLDIALGRKIIADEDRILHKIIDEHRGGFCYELNGAFAALLRALGFRVTLLSARVARANGGEGPDFDHLTLRVDLNEPWLADVGFGESFLEPLRLQTDIEQPDPAGTFRLVHAGDRLQMEKAEPDGWKRQYSFTLEPRQLKAFSGMCHYHQTSPLSSFTQKSICSRATPGGRVTLSGMKLSVTGNGSRDERREHRNVGDPERKSRQAGRDVCSTQHVGFPVANGNTRHHHGQRKDGTSHSEAAMRRDTSLGNESRLEDEQQHPHGEENRVDVYNWRKRQPRDCHRRSA